MSVVRIPGVSVGQLKPIMKYTSSLKSHEVDQRHWLLESLGKRDKSSALSLRRDKFPAADAYHENYVGYLSRCWSDHLGAVVSPDIIWYMLMCAVHDQQQEARSDRPDR